MSEVIHIIGGLGFFVCWLAAARYWIIIVVNVFRAKAHRKSPLLGRESFFKYLFHTSDMFTEEGERAAAKVRHGALGFIASRGLGFIFGWLGGFAH